MQLRTLAATLLFAPVCLAPALLANDDDKGFGAPSNYVYVNSNNNFGNTVLAYHRNPVTGALSEIHGSPFATGGTGFYNADERLGPDDHDQEIVITPDHRFLYVVNQGSGTVAAFNVRSDGSLDKVPGSPFPSGGVQPASLGMNGPELIVMNRGDQNPGGLGGTHAPSYKGFLILPNGALLPLPWTGLNLVPGSSPTQALVSPNGRVMFDTHLFEVPFDNMGLPPFIPKASSVLHSYKFNILGQLVPADQVTPPAGIPPFILGLQVHPTKKYLYAGYVVAGVLAAYKYDDDGNMTLTGSAAGSPSNGLCWVEVSPDGKWVYTSDAISDHVDVFSIANPAVPVLASTIDLGGPRAPVNFPIDATLFDTTPFQLRTSPDGKFLYVVNHEATVANTALSGNALHILKVNANGTLTEIPSSPLIFPHNEVPLTAHPLGIVVI